MLTATKPPETTKKVVYGCPTCGAETRVLYTKAQPQQILRRRECLGDGHRFTTLESFAARDLRTAASLGFVMGTKAL